MWGVVGQERAAAALARAVGEGRVAHAYLLVGPERVGKRTLALKLAQALNCRRLVDDGGLVSPCGECDQCRRIAGGLHADVQVVTVEQAEDGDAQKGIHVSQIREVERASALKPFEGRSRFVIIDPAEEMNPSAQNAFLKTLEEPPPQVSFVLLTADESRLLETVRSRCRRVELRLPSVAEVEQALAERGVEAERARLLSRLSRGRVGWALEAAEDATMLERRDETIAGARELASMSVAQRLALAERTAGAYRRSPGDVQERLRAWRDWWRDVLLVTSGAEDGVLNVDRMSELRQDAEGADREALAEFVAASGNSIRYLQENAQARLVLETLLLSAPRRAEAALT